jgi:hypothetical protein
MISKKQKAIKILTQYERLANKFNIQLSPQKIEYLNRLRDNGLIKIADLPAKLHNEFPGEFRDLTLDEIKSDEQ